MLLHLFSCCLRIEFAYVILRHPHVHKRVGVGSKMSFALCCVCRSLVMFWFTFCSVFCTCAFEENVWERLVHGYT